MTTDNLLLGIDLGTTSISAAVTDISGKCQLESVTVVHHADTACAQSAFHEQDAALICEKALAVAEELTGRYPGIRAIGLTGQMHGIVYLDAEGSAASHLINWQDKRGDMLVDGETCCDRIHRLTGMHVATGYGLVSHYYNMLHGLVPANAAAVCSIMDYVGMRLTGRKTPLMHDSVAASFGLFDIENCRFDPDALNALDIDNALLPQVTDEYSILGTYKNTAVSIAIGDNQASILGSVKDIDNSVLVNIGTGSQISTVTQQRTATASIEIRPLVKGRSIACASALCGGSAYALLERFFREYATFAGLDEDSQYDVINRLVLSEYRRGAAPLDVEPCFLGKRHNPAATGTISGITYENFTPGRLALGIVHGMCTELHDQFIPLLQGKRTLVASGNAVQRIPVLREVLSDVFGLPVQLSLAQEEASLGAALFAATAAGLLPGPESFGSFISYK